MRAEILFCLWTLGAVSAMAADGFVLLANRSPVPVKIDHAKLVSRENDNSRFQLTLERTRPFPHDYGKMGLAIGGTTIRFTSGGFHSPTNHTVGAVIHGEERAAAVAEHLKIQALKRRHPGHQLVVRFQAAPNLHLPDGGVMAELRLRNVGRQDFTFLQGGRQRGYRDNQFAFSCEFSGKMLPDVGKPVNFGGPGSFKTIAPGQTHTIRVDLSRWFKFSQPGTYALRGSYYLGIMDAVSGRTAWEDIVADEFSITIK